MANTSIEYGLLAKVQTDIKALITGGTITGIATDSVLLRKVPSDRDFNSNPGTNEYAYPGILICPAPLGISLEPRTNASDTWGFPVLITSVAQDDQDVTSNLDLYLGWGEKIVAAFVTKGLVTTDPATTFNSCEIDPGPPVNWDRWLKGVFSNFVILRFFTSRIRS